MSTLTPWRRGPQRRLIAGLAAIGSVVIVPGAARALGQEAATTRPPVSQPGDPPPRAVSQGTPDPDQQMDAFDYLRRLRHKPPLTDAEEKAQARRLSTVIVPIVGAKPSSGLSVGAGASLEFPLGDQPDTFVSSVLVGGSVSTKKQYSVSFRPVVYGARNQWLLSGDNHYQLTGQDTYALGWEGAGHGVNVRYKSAKFVDMYYRQIADGIFAGAGFQYQRQSDVKPSDDPGQNWEQSPYVRYTGHAGFDPAGQTSAGLSVGLRRDSRDNVSDPNAGWFAEATYRAYIADFLGGASTWQRLYLDARTYKSLTKNGRQKIAFWTYGDFVTAGTAPYLMLPATGTDTQGRSGRGYTEGRFRGDQLVYGEVEYRVSLRRDGLVGMVGFLNATTVGSTYVNEPLFGRSAVGAGFGFRLRLQRRSRTNLCLDFGWGRDGSRGTYIALAEAF